MQVPPGNRSTTPVRLDVAQTFQVTHVFHPLHGHELSLLDQYIAWGEDRVYCHDDTDRLRHLPTAWTTAAPPDPFVEVSAGRSHFRVEDLLQLAVLIARQTQAPAPRLRRPGFGALTQHYLPRRCIREADHLCRWNCSRSG